MINLRLLTGVLLGGVLAGCASAAHRYTRRGRPKHQP